MSVVFSEILFRDSLNNWYLTSGAAIYASLLASLSPSKSPNNKEISSLARLAYSFPAYHTEEIDFSSDMKRRKLLKKPRSPITIRSSKLNRSYQENIDYKIDDDVLIWMGDLDKVSVVYNIEDLKDLVNSGYVVFSADPKGHIVVSQASVDYTTSVFSSIQSVRAVQSIIYTIKSMALEMSIGETTSRISIFEEWIDKYLNYLESQEEIESYNLLFEYPSNDEMVILLSVLLFSELNTISVEVLVEI